MPLNPAIIMAFMGSLMSGIHELGNDGMGYNVIAYVFRRDQNENDTL